MTARPSRPLSLPPIGAEPRRRRDRETEDQRSRRLARLTVQLAERERRARREIASLTGALPRNRRGAVTALETIQDPERCLAVLKARVERLEAVLAKLNRKRETRAKIVLGAALFAEARDLGDDALLARFRDILDRRVERPQDRLAIVEAFGIELQPITESLEGRLEASPALPDFDALLAPSARTLTLRGGQVHPDYAGLRTQPGDVNDPPLAEHHPPPGDRPEG